MPKAKRQIPFSAKSVKKGRPPPPQKPKNTDQRKREYLSDSEVDQLRKSASSQGRHGLRDDTLILLMFRHGLRVSEAISLRWEQVDLKKGHLHVNRLKNGLPCVFHTKTNADFTIARTAISLFREHSFH